MKKISMKKLFINKDTANIIIIMASILLVYLLASIYFANHFFFNTLINEVNVSLKAHDDADNIIRSYVKGYKLQLIERNGEVEEIIGQDIELQYNEENGVSKIYHRRNSLQWINSLFRKQKYYVNDLFVYNEDNLENKIKQLNCLNKEIINPQNVRFKYSNGSYETIEEIYGNKINIDRLKATVKMSILQGETKLDLNEKLCYENPKYTLSSDKTSEIKNLLNKYVSAKITYVFGSEREMLGGSIINQWLSVDENLDVIVSEFAAEKFLRSLSKKYDTVGITRLFRTSIGKKVAVTGGLYGWKINIGDEAKALLENIKQGIVIDKEPLYAQKAVSRGDNEIGNTYVEINITRQHLWFYKNGRLITQGAVVTGNPNRNNATVLGTYMLNYKDKGANLRGPGYEAEVTYWMPFFGNIGIHDATWRHSFGGNIYKTKGSHGCVNAPLYLAEKIFENIEEGTPIICYEE